MSERLGIYPYSEETCPLVRHRGLLTGYELAGLAAPKSWGVPDGGDAPVVRARLEELLPQIDALVYPNLTLPESIEKMLLDSVCAVVPGLRSIYCDARLHDANHAALAEACRRAGCALYSKRDTPDVDEAIVRDVEERSLRRISAPVVMVAGLWEGVDKFEVSLALRERFLRDGYRVSQIGSRSYCELLGFHSFPAFMLDPAVDGADKILYMNRYVRRIAQSEDAQIVLLTVPGAIACYNERFTNGFGLLANQTMQAVVPDYLLMCNFWGTQNATSTESIGTVCRYRFGHTVDGYHVSNMFIDTASSMERGSVTVKKVAREMVSDALAALGVTTRPVVNAWQSDGADALYAHILHTLSSDVPTTDA